MKAIVGTVIAVVVAGLTAAGCGGSKSKPATTTTHTTTSTRHAAGGESAATATSPTVTSGPVHASLHGANHAPTVGKHWAYTVHATAASGKPLSGRVDTEFAFAGTVVGHEAPPIHRLKDGVLHDTITFPSSAVGHPITLVTVIRTNTGSVALGWPVTATK
jgi:hypothetical protein